MKINLLLIATILLVSCNINTGVTLNDKDYQGAKVIDTIKPHSVYETGGKYSRAYIIFTSLNGKRQYELNTDHSLTDTLVVISHKYKKDSTKYGNQSFKLAKPEIYELLEFTPLSK